MGVALLACLENSLSPDNVSPGVSNAIAACSIRMQRHVIFFFCCLVKEGGATGFKRRDVLTYRSAESEPGKPVGKVVINFSRRI
jgi:hypothetical protein